MDVKIYYKDLMDFEMFLFSLKVSKEMLLHLSFYDSEEKYEYQTIKIADALKDWKNPSDEFVFVTVL